VEIKSYPDGVGKAESVDIRSASRQAAVGVVGFRNIAVDGVQDVGGELDLDVVFRGEALHVLSGCAHWG